MSTADLKVELKESESTSKDTHSVIGKDNAFSGEFRSNGHLRIDGDYKGVIKGYGVVLVGQNGRIVGDIYAQMVRIGGKIKGNVYALDRVDILSTGKLIGDLYTKKCQADEGMIFTGQAKIVDQKELDAIFDKNVKNVSHIITEDF